MEHMEHMEQIKITFANEAGELTLIVLNCIELHGKAYLIVADEAGCVDAMMCSADEAEELMLVPADDGILDELLRITGIAVE